MPGGKAAHHNGRRLTADIAAHAGDDRDEGDQSNDFIKGGLKHPHQITGDETTEKIGE